MKQAFEACNENIQSLADRLEISNLLMEFALAIDNEDWTALNDIFAPGAVIDCTASGGAQGKYHQLNTLLRHTPPRIVSNADIRVDGDTASGRTICHTQAEHLDTLARDVCNLKVCYVDKFVRTDRGWRITERIQQQVCS